MYIATGYTKNKDLYNNNNVLILDVLHRRLLGKNDMS